MATEHRRWAAAVATTICLLAASCSNAPTDQGRAAEPTTTTTEQTQDPTAAEPTTTTTEQTQDPTTTTGRVGQLRERDTSPEATGEAVAQVVRGANELAVDFFKTVADPSENFIVGNYSLSTALLLAMAGTAGDTTVAFSHLLGVEDVETNELHPAVNAVDLALESRSGEGVRLSTANTLFVQDGLQLRDEFLDTAVESYGAPVRTVDFRQKGSEATAAVNQWVADETEGFIDRITDGFAESTVVVLANAMFLQASWKLAFERAYRPGSFTLADGTTVETDYMLREARFPLSRDSDPLAVELPYRGDELGMVIVQPADLAAFEEELSAERLLKIAGSLSDSKIDLRVPLWSTKTGLNARGPLQELGLPRTYDFGTMVDPATLVRFGGRLTIDKILHIARIEVDEKGTTAAAATVIGGSATSVEQTRIVRIDRPFLYFIRDRATDAILFIGHVANPASDAGVAN